MSEPGQRLSDVLLSCADERVALAQWLQHHTTSPVTRQPLQSDFRRNHALRQLIESWEQARPQLFTLPALLRLILGLGSIHDATWFSQAASKI